MRGLPASSDHAATRMTRGVPHELRNTLFSEDELAEIDAVLADA